MIRYNRKYDFLPIFLIFYIYSHLGIVNWAQVAEHYGKIFEENGGKIHMDFNATSINANEDSSFPLRIKSANNEVKFTKLYSIIKNDLNMFIQVLHG